MSATTFSLSRKDHLAIFLALLVERGALCPACGHGTRATSKRWARCRNCDARVSRGAEGEVRR